MLTERTLPFCRFVPLRRVATFCLVIACLVVWCRNCTLHAFEHLPSERHVELTARIRVQPVAATGEVRVWIPVPQESESQQVSEQILRGDLALQPTHDEVFGNRMLYATGAATGRPIEFKIRWEVRRQEVLKAVAFRRQLSEALWLRSSPRVPRGGLPVTLLAGVGLPDQTHDRAQLFYHRVLEHMTYDKSRPGYGTGDAVWACDSRFGNCTDFHSLFLSLARSHGIPSRFEMGYPLPEDHRQGTITGYHCWAWYRQADNAWLPVDISEADKHPELADYYFGRLSPNRVLFSIGRDIQLQPSQQAGPLNYFAEPYAEFDGRSLLPGQMDFTLTFRDLPPAGH